jgi:hypothetical protein
VWKQQTHLDSKGGTEGRGQVQSEKEQSGKKEGRGMTDISSERENYRGNKSSPQKAHWPLGGIRFRRVLPLTIEPTGHSRTLGFLMCQRLVR